MPDTIFTAREEDLARLIPGEAVGFFRNLLWAEGRRVGIPLDKIHVSHRIDVPDGGIDAEVADTVNTGDSGIISVGCTGYLTRFLVGARLLTPVLRLRRVSHFESRL